MSNYNIQKKGLLPELASIVVVAVVPCVCIRALQNATKVEIDVCSLILPKKCRLEKRCARMRLDVLPKNIFLNLENVKKKIKIFKFHNNAKIKSYLRFCGQK